MTKILLVDDDEQIRFAMSEVLGGHGYHVRVAENGIQASKILDDENVDVVLLDIFMPECDGFETIGHIRQNHPDLKIIAMSGYGDSEFEPLRYAKTLGADDALAKPFSAEQMVEMLVRFGCSGKP
ncbi:response regulator [Terasakiella sp.]|uniref:response regulator n=1 Tax=Terasakiella sp. TaxID=2034861 RepID=UPI003AA977CF